MENVKILLAFLGSLGMAVDKAKADDGKFTLTDVKYLVEPGMSMPGAIAAAPLAKDEWEKATDEERAKCITDFKAGFAIYDKNAEKKIEAGIAMLIQAGEFFA